MSRYRIGIEPEYDSDNTFPKDVKFEFERVSNSWGETTRQMKIHLQDPDREILLRGDGLRALYQSLKSLVDPSLDEID